MPSPRPLILGLTGPVGSGVTTISKLLEARCNFIRVSLSAKINEDLAAIQDTSESAKDKPPLFKAIDPERRRRLQDYGNEKRKERLTYWLDKALEGIDASKDVVIDCLRNLGELNGLRDRFTNTQVIGVVATRDARWKRIQGSYEGNQRTFERDDDRDSNEEIENGQQVQSCVLAADFILVNEDELPSDAFREKSLLNQLNPAIEIMRGGGGAVRHPTAEETYMAMAYAQSHASRCLKRHVGAVIVSDDGIPISSGFNENPGDMKPCLIQFMGLCYKDEDMHAQLEQMSVHCPNCGKMNEKLQRPWKCECGENLKIALFRSRNMEVCTAIHAEERSISLFPSKI